MLVGAWGLDGGSQGFDVALGAVAPHYLVALWLGQASEEENQFHPPWGSS